MRRTLLVVVAAATLAAPAARADGDPASDYLYTQHVFVPFDVKASPAKQKELASAVEGAIRAGFPIRVAVIGSVYDLGAVPSLWRKPDVYARFLGQELEFVYKQRLLVVMPNGLGFYWRGKPVTHERALVHALHVGPGANGLVDAATAAVRKLAEDAGVPVQAARAPKSTTTRDRIIVLVAAIGLLALAVLVRFALLRRRR
jgi:hypothetical protein